MTFELSFQFTEAFLIETMRRFRRQSQFRSLRLGLRAVGVPFMLFTAAVAFRHGDVAPAALMTGGGILAVFLTQLEDWRLRRAFRKSPYHNQPIVTQVSEEGILTTSPKSQAKLTWAAYTRAVRFPDGVLLFQGPRMINWLPFSALRDAATAEPLVRLIASKIAASRTCGAVVPSPQIAHPAV